MIEFIADLFNACGLGVNGFIKNVSHAKDTGMFNGYDLHQQRVDESHLSVTVSKGGRKVFTAMYKHSPSGHVEDLTIIDETSETTI